MNKIVLILNIIIRSAIILAGILIEFNVLGLTNVQLESVKWIGRFMIVFGILRLGWLFYQLKQQKDISLENDHEE
ncbi:hypothetical protein EBV26_02795 [bacterium]|nr:hypothetical protein [bacterium]